MALTQEIGQAAENLALRYLRKKGWVCVTRNYACRYGEIDLVMRDSQEWVFVEVRYREGSGYGTGVDSVTVHKQRKLIKAAQYYLQQHQLSDTLPMRFDVIGINQKTEIEWIPNAFSV